MSFRNQKVRLATFALAPIVLAALMIWSNDSVDTFTNIVRAQPFFIMFVSKIVMICVLIVQHPIPAGGYSKWRFWEWLDPVTIVLVFMFAGSALYYSFLWGGQSTRFEPPPEAYHVTRVILLVDGYVSFVIGSEMLSRAIIARRDKRRRVRLEYDLRERNGIVGKGGVTNGAAGQQDRGSRK